jgi:hypothetical protein
LVGRKDDSIHEMVIWGAFPKYQRQRVKSWCFFLRKVHLADGFGLWIVCGCLQAQTVSHRTQESKVFWSMDYSSSRCEDTCGGILLPTILQHRITVMALIYKIWVQPYLSPVPLIFRIEMGWVCAPLQILFRILQWSNTRSRKAFPDETSKWL